jgi:PAS domain S-box-containing protein
MFGAGLAVMNRFLQFFEGRLQRRLTFYLLPLVVLPILIVGSLLLVSYQNFARQALIDQELAFIQKDQLELQQYLQNAQDDLRYLSNTGHVIELAEGLLQQDNLLIQEAKSEVSIDFAALVASRGIYDQVRFLDVAGNEIVRVDYDPQAGAIIVADSALQNKADRAYFNTTIRLAPGELYISPLDLNREGTPPQIEVLPDGSVVPTLRYATPIYVTTATTVPQLAGIIVTNLIAQQFLDLSQVQRANSEVFLLNSDGYYLYHSARPELAFAFEAGISTVRANNLEGEAGLVENVLFADAAQIRNATTAPANLITTADNGRFLIDYVKIVPPGAADNQYFILADANEQAVFFAPLQNTIFASVIALVATLALGLVGVTFVTRQLSRPLQILEQQAEQVASGDLNITSIPELITRQDEIGTLSNTFTGMTSRLKELLGSLEAQIADRTADLATSADIASAANQVRELNDLLSLVVNLIRDRFNFYYVQIYLVDNDRQYAVLREGTGYVGRRLLVREHKLALNETSLVAQAIRQGKPVVTQNTLSDPTFRPNDLLPDTRSELVIPLKTQDTVIAVLDIQHNIPNAFETESIKLFQTLTEQLAVTFENVRLLENTARRARELQTVAEVSAAASSTLNMSDMLRRVSRLTRDNFGLYHAHVYLLDDAKDNLVLAAGAGEVGLQMVENQHAIALNNPKSLVARAARDAHGVIANDVRSAPDFLPNPLLPETRSELAVPLVVNQEVMGVLDVQSKNVNQFDADDVRIQTTLAGQIAIAVQNARTFAAIQQAQSTLQQQGTILENAEDFIALTTLDGTLIYANPGAANMLGYAAPSDLYGRRLVDLHDTAAGRVVLETAIPQAITAGSWNGENRLITAQGTFIPVEQTFFVVRDTLGQPRNIATIMVDITDRKTAEEEQATLFSIATALNEARSPEMVVDAIMTHVPYLNIDTTNLFYVNSGLSGQPDILEVVASRGSTAEVMTIPPGTQFALQEFDVLAAWLDNPQQIVLHENILMDDQLDEMSKAIYMQFGAQAIARLPLHLYGRWIGLLLMNWSVPRLFTPRDKRLLNSLVNQVKATVESIRTADDILKRANELETVATVSAEASGTLDTDTLIQNVVTLTKQRFGLYHAHIYLLSDDGEYLVLAGGAGEPGRIMKDNGFKLSMQNKNSLVVQVARTRQSVISNDVTMAAAYLPNPLLPDTRSELAVPILAGNKLLGVLDVQADKVNYFTADDAGILFTLATQVAIGIQNARSYSDSLKRANELQIVAQVGAEAATNLDLENMLRVVCELTKQEFQLYHVHVYLLETNAERLNLAAGAGTAGDEMVARRHQIALKNEYSLVARAARTRQGVVSNDVSAAPDYLPNALLPETRSELAVPMVVGNELIGVLDVQASELNRFSADDIRIQSTLASQIAIAVKNARLFKEVNDIRYAIDQHAIVAITDQRGIIQYANQKFSDIAQYEIEELLGQDHRLINSGYHDKDYIRNVWTTIANGEVWKGEFLNRAKDGSNYWVETTIVPFLNNAGKPYQYISIRTDITAAKAAQQEIERRATELEAVAQISAAIAATRNLDELLWAVANQVQEKFHRYHAQVYLLDESSETLILKAGSGKAGQLMVARGHRISMKQLGSIVATAATTRTPQVVQDVNESDFFLPNPLLSETQSELAVPIIYGDTLLGVLDIQDNKTYPFSDVEVQVKTTLANQIAVAIQNALAFEATIAAQQETERIFTSSIDLLGSATFDGYFTRLNPAWSQLLGFSDEELMAEPFVSFVHPEDVETTLAEAAKLSTGVKVISFENRYRCKDGSYRWISWRSAPDMENALIHFVARDVTDQKLAAETIAAAQKETERIFTSSIDLLGSATFDGYFTRLNPAWSQLLGFSDDELMAAPFVSFVHPEDVETTLAEAAKLSTGVKVISFENRYRCKDGSYRWISWRSAPDMENALIHFVARDVTDRVTEQEEQFLLYEISSRLTDAQTPQEIYEAVMAYGEAAGIAWGGLFYFQDQDEHGYPLWAETAYSWQRQGAAPFAVGARFHLPDYPFVRTWFAGHDTPIFYREVATNPQIDENSRHIYQQFGTESGVVLMLQAQNRWVGFIMMNWSEDRTFTEQDSRILTTVMRQSTSAVDAIRAADMTRTARRRAEILADINSALSQAATEETILGAIGLYIEAYHPTQLSLMYVQTDTDGTPISITSVKSRRNGMTDDDDPLLGIEFQPDEYPLGHFLLQYPEELILVNDYAQDDRLDEIVKALLEQFEYISFASLPLLSSGLWQGVLLISWAQPHFFSEEEAYILSQLIDTTSAVVATRRAALLTEKRANELEAVARVSAATTTMLNVNELLQTVVELTKSSFELYHAHIYLLDEDNKRLLLAAGAGEPGAKMKAAGHNIVLNHPFSLVARAARTRTGILTNDVTLAEAYLPNPLLPETRSEMAIPMIVGDELIGILDVQSTQINRFNESDLRVKTTLADQVAVAILNARAFERERRTIERLREVDRLKQEFLANMSHELRTPLNSIIGYSEVLIDGVDGDLSDEAMEDVEAIHNSGKHLLSLINEILDMAKIEAGQMQLSLKDVNLIEFLQDVVRNNQILLKNKPVTMQLVEDNPLLGVISGDKIRLSQVMLNLLSNAVKFTEAGSITISYGMHDEQTAYVRVTDTGIGMKESHLNMIFERFRQVDGSSTRRAGGTGLGLAITRQLIEMHHGEIYVESEEGKGSSFWFTLPLSKPVVAGGNGSHSSGVKVPSGD